eukprot:gene16718-717_t
MPGHNVDVIEPERTSTGTAALSLVPNLIDQDPPRDLRTPSTGSPSDEGAPQPRMIVTAKVGGRKITCTSTADGFAAKRTVIAAPAPIPEAPSHMVLTDQNTSK